jgi:hypothetical protein
MKGKDAMSRLSVLVLSLGLASSVVGCADFTVGVCDCDRDPRGCERYAMGGGGPGCAGGHHGVAPALTPVPVQVPSIDAPKPIPVAPAR